MVGAGLWGEKQIDALEKETLKELMLLPNDINRNAVVNLVMQKPPVKHTIIRIVNRINVRTDD